MLQRFARALPEPDAADVALILTEIVSNVLRHGCAGGGADVDVTLWRRPGMVRIEVMQSGPVFEPAEVRQRRPGVDRGWGILILDRMCKEWGVDPMQRCVWAEVAVDDF